MSNNNESNIEKDSMFNLVKVNYGSRLSTEELDEIKKAVHDIQKTTESLRRVKLKNSDEPILKFEPYRKEK